MRSYKRTQWSYLHSHCRSRRTGLDCSTLHSNDHSHKNQKWTEQCMDDCQSTGGGGDGGGEESNETKTNYVTAVGFVHLLHTCTSRWCFRPSTNLAWKNAAIMLRINIDFVNVTPLQLLHRSNDGQHVFCVLLIILLIINGWWFLFLANDFRCDLCLF